MVLVVPPLQAILSVRKSQFKTGNEQLQAIAGPEQYAVSRICQQYQYGIVVFNNDWPIFANYINVALSFSKTISRYFPAIRRMYSIDTRNLRKSRHSS
jgi:hypothetical protein